MSTDAVVQSEVRWMTHASEIEYRTFLSTAPSDLGKEQLKNRRRFVRAYPDLSSWIAAPLAERVGSARPRRGAAYTCAISRPYLYFLVYAQRIRLDWNWILAVNYHELAPKLLPDPVNALLDTLVTQAVQLGYALSGSRYVIRRVLKYLHLHNPQRAQLLTEDDLIDFEQALTAFADRPDVAEFFGSTKAWHAAMAEHRRSFFMLRTLLYHRHAADSLPRKFSKGRRRLYAPPKMAALLQRYLEARRAQHSRPATISAMDSYVRHFTNWLATAHPSIDSFAEVTRNHVLAYAATLQTSASPDGAVTSTYTKAGRISALSVFFQDTTGWGWDDAPTRFLISARDRPKHVNCLPRYIPSDELERLMPAIRSLTCPYQRAALIVARWSGARRGEIRNLEFYCVDNYPDGTPRLRLPATKTAAERLIPLHEEAAQAIRQLQTLNMDARGFPGSWGEREAKRLFVNHGRILGCGYLFAAPLLACCAEVGIMKPSGALRITAHRFRHTVGTELAEGGARLHTIMRMLGHTSTGVALVYAHLTDETVRDDYIKVLGPGAQIAGPLAPTLLAGGVPRESIDWIKANFFRTELELGHCLRLPHEGPCECDLYLTCAKFVTTLDHAPRLRARRTKELELIHDARAQGWDREVDRHACTLRRIEQLLSDLGEPVIEPLGTAS
jgi:integrase